MFTMVNESSRRMVSAVAAVAIVAFAGVALDQGHRGGAPEGAVRVGELTLVNPMKMAGLTLPEITVTAARQTPEQGRLARADGRSASPVATQAGSAGVGSAE